MRFNKNLIQFLTVLTLLIVFFTPETVFGNWLQLLSFILFLIIQHNGITINRQIGTYLFFIIFLISIIGSYITARTGIIYQSLMKNSIILVFFFVFPIIYNRNVLNFKILVFLCFAIAVSQIIVTLDINPFSNIIKAIYYIEDPRYNVRDNMTFILEKDYRSSGFILNPNETAKFLSVILCAYMIVCFSTTKQIHNLFFFVIFSISMILTGSRTGFVITILVVFSYLIFIKKVNRLKKIFLIIGIFCIPLLLLILGVPLRSVMFTSGFESSLMTKTDFLLNYLVQLNNGFVILFGNFNPETVEALYPHVFSPEISFFDSDVGYFIYAFGFLGLIALIFKIKDIFNTTDYGIIILPIFLWSLTASIFFYFRFLIFFIIIISLAISQQETMEK